MILDLDPCTPPPPHLGTPFLGGWGGENFFEYCGRCVCIWTWVLKNFFLVQGGGISRGEYFVVGNFVFQMCAKFPAQFSGRCAK